MKNVMFTKASLKTRREMSTWSCLARQRSGLLVIFLLLLALTVYKEFEGRGEEEVDEGGMIVKRIFEGEVKNDFDENPGEFNANIKLDSFKESDAEEGDLKESDVEGDIIEEDGVEEDDVEEDDVEQKPGKTQPRCHFRAPTENR